MGLRLKSTSPFSCMQDNSLEFNLEGRSRFSVISACLSRQTQFCIRKSGSVAHSHTMKLSLNFLIALSAVLRL